MSEYNKSLDLYDNIEDKSLLEQTILNNIFKGNNQNSKFVNIFSDYMIKNINNFKSKSENDNLNSQFAFTNFR